MIFRNLFCFWKRSLNKKSIPWPYSAQLTAKSHTPTNFRYEYIFSAYQVRSCAVHIFRYFHIYSPFRNKKQQFLTTSMYFVYQISWLNNIKCLEKIWNLWNFRHFLSLISFVGAYFVMSYDYFHILGFPAQTTKRRRFRDLQLLKISFGT